MIPQYTAPLRSARLSPQLQPWWRCSFRRSHLQWPLPQPLLHPPLLLCQANPPRLHRCLLGLQTTSPPALSRLSRNSNSRRKKHPWLLRYLDYLRQGSMRCGNWDCKGEFESWKGKLYLNPSARLYFIFFSLTSLCRFLLWLWRCLAQQISQG